MKSIYEAPSVKKQANLKEITKCDDGSISHICDDGCKPPKPPKPWKWPWHW